MCNFVVKLLFFSNFRVAHVHFFFMESLVFLKRFG